MIPSIKICGITRPEDISLCVEHDIEYIGLNFIPSSPRYVTMAQAKELRFVSDDIKVVGIFQDEDASEVSKIARELSLDVVQLHGQEDLAYITSLNFPTIKAFRFVPSSEELKPYIASGVRILLDGRANAEHADWDAIMTLPDDIRSQIILAGGLTPENVFAAVRKIQPFAVDVATGIESAPGIKDPALLASFVSEVRSGYHA